MVQRQNSDKWSRIILTELANTLAKRDAAARYAAAIFRIPAVSDIDLVARAQN